MTIHDEHGNPVSDATATYVGRRKSAPKRKGKTPEALVSAAVDRYLKKIGAINIRTNAGSWQDEAGHYIQGAKAGTSDKVICLRASEPGGRAVFCAVETKSAKGKLTEAQEKYLARVRSMGGVAIVARSATDVRNALIEEFGEAVVREWEKG